MTTSITYRPDIDGLRAIAVLAVVFFHAGFGAPTGGYVGVDVFFVISGFLITSIVVDEIRRGTFTFAGFYERRIRRIFPALFVVIFATLAVGWYVLAPMDYKNLARSAINTTFFISNIAFNNKAGYFAPAAETQPLLHTWSLAVEEQFYLIAPVALIAITRLGLNVRRVTLGAAALASLLISAYGVSQEASWAFYLLHSRAWELMIGMILGLALVPQISNRFTAEAVGLAGLAMIAAACFAYAPETPFPGFAALLPCLGAACIIHSATAQTTATSRLLATPPLVFIGKISYSLYLWHWPLFAFATYEFGHELTASHRVALIALAVLLSIATWAFVEQPARRRRGETTQRRVFAAGTAVMAACVAVSLGISHTRGALGRLSPDAQAAIKVFRETGRMPKHCLPGNGNDRRYSHACTIGATDAPQPRFVLWGDSHAMAIAKELSRQAKDAGSGGEFVAMNGCAPVFGVETLPNTKLRRCLEASNQVKALLRNPAITDVVIFSRWAVHTEGSGMPGEAGIRTRRYDTSSLENNRAVFTRLLRQTIETITASGRRVTLIGPVPEMPYDLRTIYIKDIMRGVHDTKTYGVPRDAYHERQSYVLAMLKELSAIPGVTVFFPEQRFCDQTWCRATINDQPLYKDDDHLSEAGAVLLTPAFRAVLSRLSSVAD